MDQETPSTSLFDLQLDQQAIVYLGEAGRWARFLAIIGFVGSGIMVLVGLFLGSFMSSAFSSMGGGASMLGGGFFAFLYVVIALLIFFPSLYLYHFGSKMRTALRSNDQELLVNSFKNLKSYLKFYGIMAIICLGLYALALVAAIVGAAVGR